MGLNKIIIFRCDEKLKRRLESLARDLGLKEGQIARNTLALAILPPENPSQIEEIVQKVKKEIREELWGRTPQ